MARKKQIVQVEEKEEEEKEEVEEEVEEEEEEEEEGKEEEEGERRRSSWVWGLFFFFLLFCGEGSTFTRSNLTKEQLINSFRLQFETLALPWFLLHSFKSFNFPPFFLSFSFFFPSNIESNCPQLLFPGSLAAAAVVALPHRHSAVGAAGAAFPMRRRGPLLSRRLG